MLTFCCVFRSRIYSGSTAGFSSSERNLVRDAEESSQDDCLPFFLDDDSSGPEGSPSSLNRRSSMKSTYGFSIGAKVDGSHAVSNASNNREHTSRHCGSRGHKTENVGSRLSHKLSDKNLMESAKFMNQRSLNNRSRGIKDICMFPFSFSYAFSRSENVLPK